MTPDTAYDCVVVGGGPAGLTAAVYLARFGRRALVVHDGESRAQWIPRTMNVPGYPHGIVGPELLERLRSQVERYATKRLAARVDRVEKTTGGFWVSAGTERWLARRVILATGVHDLIPDELRGLWPMVHEGKVRLCPVCDAYEMRDKKIGLVAQGLHAATEAQFLANYSSAVSVFTHGKSAGENEARIRRYAEGLYESRILSVENGAELEVNLEDGQTVCLDAVYIGLGVEAHTGLATRLGARCDDMGYLRVDQKQQTSVPGIYAAGDVVQSLSQISVAFGEAAIAASAINMALSQEAATVADSLHELEGGSDERPTQ
jgi:thioredoxin reductase (NADPH)